MQDATPAVRSKVGPMSMLAALRGAASCTNCMNCTLAVGLQIEKLRRKLGSQAKVEDVASATPHAVEAAAAAAAAATVPGMGQTSDTM